MNLEQFVAELKAWVQGGSADVTVWQFVFGLIGTAILCWLVSLMYRAWGQSLSNRASFGRTFVGLGMTTMLIITIVKASLALSLGLVGALSIVRFRTAIKEPEELSYLFMTIAIGLGFGANQWLVTCIALATIALVLWAQSRTQRTEEGSSLYLTVRGSDASTFDVTRLTETLASSCSGLALKRFDESDGRAEASYLVSFADHSQLEQARAAVHSSFSSVSISFIDNEGIL
tara:strand:- start:105 stop:797 length:693 start_codon:yes stop_codon:yes gene_type:complete